MLKILNKLTVDQYGTIRFLKQLLFQKKCKNKYNTTRPKIWFLDAPDYGNIGDQAIAFAIHVFCEQNLSDRELVEFQEGSVLQYIKWIKSKIKKEDIIVLQGGGNFGDLYPKYEFVRRMIIRKFPENRIILFPQSAFYKSNRRGKHECDIAKKVYGNHKRIILFARDSYSYEIMRGLFPDTDVRLCPDIVFSLIGIVRGEERRGMGICLRNDKERIVIHDKIKTQMQHIEGYYSHVEKFDMICDWNGYIDKDIRKKIVLEKLKEVSNFEVIITDRLHGMIFSYITFTPCISLDNSTGKSAGTYHDWLTNVKSVFFVESDCNYIELPIETSNFELDFEPLRKALIST